MDLEQILSKIDGIEIEIDKDMTNYSTMRLRASGSIITIKKLLGLKKTVEALSSNGIKYRVIGLGANQLLPEKTQIPYIKLDLGLSSTYFDTVKRNYTLPASVLLSTLTSHAKKFGLQGWEVFTGIPATLGGAVFMNAGTNLGHIGSVVRSVKLMTKEGESKTVQIDKDSFSYRKNNFIESGDVIYQVELIHFGQNERIAKIIDGYLQQRRSKQPLDAKTCGSVLKNSQGKVICRAGIFIDILGLKGFEVNGVRVSPVHANFIENLGEASYTNVAEMIKLIKDELYLQMGVNFEEEVQME